MITFKKYGELDKHDIGAVFDNENRQARYIGTALLCRSPKHISISININDFKFASKCLQYIYCKNCENKTILVPMEQAIEIFKHGRQPEGAEFVIIEWFELENPSTIYELPFDR
jgi:hypothetical protein